MILYVEIECHIYEAQSLKDKRAVIKKVIHRLQNSFNITISELDYQNLWQRSLIGIATLSQDRQHAEQVIDACLARIDSFTELEYRTIERQWYG
ncbi:MAG: DUF503 domain-containing protein [Amphibacillus sp.]|uniref:YlxP-like protein n=2 Tax=Amphibacillus xylanus TaxID=1449 RepID=K0IYP7_AMPXN|nr:DUF503 domain-containing protein [Amphibacillus xylanus]NMA89805.1 DUF503 domain-containing protein [Amphibacillus sp.]BAM47589.1 hypothetical protein AXY_14570 [Amphibacillus xylanus NBRC 15112]